MNVVEFFVCVYSFKVFWGVIIGLCGGFLLGVEKYRYYRLFLVVRVVDIGDLEI